LLSVNSVEMSADGRFLYATPWQLGAIVVFERDPQKGGLKHVQTLREPGSLAGNTSIAFSPSSPLAVAACFNAQTAVLLHRDAKTGKLKILDSARNGQNNVRGLAFAVDAIFSPDGMYVYVLDGNAGGIAIFKVGRDKLEWIESFDGEDQCLAGSRGVALAEDGKIMYVAGSRANSLSVLERNAETGLLKVKQMLWDEENNVHGLAGAFGVVCTRNGEFIYTTSGRFSGDDAVSAFRRGKEGWLEVVHELIAERDELPDFKGGNRLLLSPDEKNLYVVASQSGSLACFARDAKSGQVKLLESLSGDGDKGILIGAAGLAISPDGKFLYVAAEGRKTISIYRRE
jgi:6-phosphogluconolactonase (cycloisomerase 2 family)